MDSNFIDVTDHDAMSRPSGERKVIGRTAVILKMIAAATIACSFVQVLRGQCTALTVIQFWLSLFVGAAVQTAGDYQSNADDAA